MKGFKDWIETITAEEIENGFLIVVNSSWGDPRTEKHFMATNSEVVEFIAACLGIKIDFANAAELTAPDPEPVPA